MPENIPEEVEDDLSPDGTIKLATCDKETNTEAKCTLKSPSEKQASDISAAAARNSVVRRSQTFSPMGKVCPPDYICMVITTFNVLFYWSSVSQIDTDHHNAWSV